jgi:hypothetical protein
MLSLVEFPVRDGAGLHEHSFERGKRSAIVSLTVVRLGLASFDLGSKRVRPLRRRDHGPFHKQISKRQCLRVP